MCHSLHWRSSTIDSQLTLYLSGYYLQLRRNNLLSLASLHSTYILWLSQLSGAFFEPLAYSRDYWGRLSPRPWIPSPHCPPATHLCCFQGSSFSRRMVWAVWSEMDQPQQKNFTQSLLYLIPFCSLYFSLSSKSPMNESQERHPGCFFTGPHSVNRSYSKAIASVWLKSLTSPAMDAS